MTVCATRSTRASAATPVKRALLAALLLASACAPTVRLPSPSPTQTATPTGGTIRIVQPAEITTLDPWAASDDATLEVLRQVFEPLVDLEPGSERVVPKLAIRWDVAADGRTYAFTLRQGVRFHDGTPLDAAAVVRNFEGAHAPARFDLGSHIAAVVAQDASTVVFTLRAPYAPFLASLASPSFGIVSPACLAKADRATPAATCAAGTGPFVIQPGTWRSGEGITLGRNASYWDRDAHGAALPYVDALEFQVVASASSRAAAIHGGAADVALDLDPSAVAQVRSDPNIAVLRRPAYDASFLGFGAPTGRAPSRW